MLQQITSKVLWVFAVVVALLTSIKLIRRDAVKDAGVRLENTTLKEKDRKLDEGRKAVSKEKRSTDGLSDSDVVDRLRRRSSDWGGV
jgi:hypothetical protein